MSIAHVEQQTKQQDEHEEMTHDVSWWGMIIFILSEALIFANIIAGYLYLYVHNNSSWKLEGATPWLFPLINTVFLVSSSIPIRIAGKGIAQGKRGSLIGGLIGTILLGVIFLGGQAYEYINLVREGFTLKSGAFGSSFYTLTGFHGLHVTVGVLFMVICLVRAFNGHFTAKKHFAVEAAEMYWHFVDIVWLVVFTVVYLVPLLHG